MKKNTMQAACCASREAKCSYWSPGSDEYIAGEIIFQWTCRRDLRRLMVGQQDELDKVDRVLSGLLFDMKQKLSKLGRGGGWSAWLKQQKIPRSTADRLVLEYAEHFDLSDELPHRQHVEPLEGQVCQSAYRTSRRMESMLTSPKSRLAFIRCLADLLGLDVEYGEDDAARVTMPAPVEPAEIDYRVPNVIRIMDDGAILPVDYELRG